MKYIKNSPWLDISLKLRSEFDDKFVDISHKIDASAGGSGRSDAIRNITNVLSIISANVLKNNFLQSHLNIQVDRSNDGYRRDSFNPSKLNARSIRKVVNFLRYRKPAFIEISGGNYDHLTENGYTTQLRETNEFLDFLIKIINEKRPIRCDIYPITRSIFNIEEYTMLHSDLFDISPVPSIRLREGSSKERSSFIKFTETDQTRRMEENIIEYNSFIEKQWIDLFVTGKEFGDIQRDIEEKIDDFGEREPSAFLVDLVSGRRLYRVFNNGRFTDGGRFYGGWWQSIRSDYRRFITINGTPTVEVDFSSMQVAMLYAMFAQDLKEDAYAIEGVDPSYRDLIKKATLKLINATGRLRAPLKSELPPNLTWEELQSAIRERHAPIAEFLGSGEGIRLQRLDSDIAEDIMMSMLGKNIVALPVHDSFFVPEGHEDELRDAMITAYKKKMGDRVIGLKRSPSLFDDLLTDEPDLTGTERHRLAMERFHERKQRPEYEGYRRREEWASGTATGGVIAKEDRRHSHSSSYPGVDELTGPRAPRERMPIREGA